jgi:hypothetical protein
MRHGTAVLPAATDPSLIQAALPQLHAPLLLQLLRHLSMTQAVSGRRRRLHARQHTIMPDFYLYEGIEELSVLQEVGGSAHLVQKQLHKTRFISGQAMPL